MSKTRFFPVYGSKPPCSIIQRLEERKQKARAVKMELHRKNPDKPEDFITYEDSDSEEETPVSKHDILNTSYNFVDYIKSREIESKNVRSVTPDYGSRHVLTHEMFKETNIGLGNINKVFCSQWLTDRQIVFGTKCNKLMAYDVPTRKLDQIPLLMSRRKDVVIDQQHSGIYSIQINSSRTLLASTARNTNDIAIYSLPTLDPVCVGENAHKDLVFDVCWLDDEHLVSGSRESTMALWKVKSSYLTDIKEGLPVYDYISPVCVKECRNAQRVRAVTYNKPYSELGVLSLNGYIHIWSSDTFKQKISRKLPSSQENVCIAVQQESGLYAIGCRSYTLVLDCRTLQPMKKISTKYSGCGVRSASFQGDILTIGTGVGMLLFYDIRAGKYLESSINSTRAVSLKASKGYVFPDPEYADVVYRVKYIPAVYTHCYDRSGTRLFTAGGPLPATLNGNYAGLWQ